MLLLMPSLAAAITITVGDGDSLASACELAKDKDVIEIVAGRTILVSDNYCDLGAIDGVIVQGSGGVARVAGIRIIGGTNIGLRDLELTEYQELGYVLSGSQANGLSLQSIVVVDPTEFGVYLFDSDAVQIENLSDSRSGAVQDTLLSIFVQPSAPPVTVTVDGVVASGPGARIEVLGPGSLTVNLSNVDLNGGRAVDEMVGGCVSIAGTGVGPTVTLENPTLKECSAPYGGAVLVELGELYIKGGSLSEGYAIQGGGLHVASGGSAYLSDGVVLEANYGSMGAAIYVGQGKLVAQDMQVRSNHSDVDIFEGLSPSGGALLAIAPKKMEISDSQFCANKGGGVSDQEGSAITMRGGSAQLDHLELRGNREGIALVFLAGAHADFEHLSVWDNSQDLLIASGEQNFTLTNSLMAHAAMGYVFPGSAPGVGFNYWYDVTTPNVAGPMHGSDISSSSDPLFVGDPSGVDCTVPLNLEPGSPLIDQGTGTDPDGTDADIGAHYYDKSGDTGGESGDTSVVDPQDSRDTGDSGGTGDSTVVDDTAPVDSPPPAVVRLVGGCRSGQLGSAGGSVVLLLGLLLLRRRRDATGSSL